jgi:plastocyanin
MLQNRLMRRVALLAGLTCLVAAPASLGGTSVRIAVSAAGPKPASAAAQVGKPVTWVNATGTRRRVASVGGRFAAFTLAAHGSHTLRFAAAGRYPYVVDGRRHGVVVVGAGGGPPGGGAGGTTLPTTWSGLYRADAASNGGAGFQACSTSWSGALHVTVGSGGAVSGGGVADEVPGSASCALYLDPNRVVGLDYTISGTISGQTMTLTLTLTGLRGGGGGEGSGLVSHISAKPTFKLAITGARAAADASFTYPFGNGGTITSHDTLSLSGS